MTPNWASESSRDTTPTLPIIGRSYESTNWEPSTEWLRSEAQKQGIAFADWYPAAQSVLANIDAVPLKNEHSGGHYRAWVNRVIAEEYARRIVAASGQVAEGPP
jgi:hypothetical protein